MTKHSKYTYQNPKGEHVLTESSIDELIPKKKKIRGILKKILSNKKTYSNIIINGL